MGKRRHWAAWGATFALLVAACTATESQTSSRAPLPNSSSTPERAIPTSVSFPESLADASFVQAALSDGPCVAGDASQISLHNPRSGAETWSFSIPRPGAASVVDGSDVYLSFRWDRGQHPGIAALDLAAQAPRWQRFLPSEVEQMTQFESTLIVVTAEDVRAVDIDTGDDIWVNRSQFDFNEVVLGDTAAYTLDSVGVHAIDFGTGRELWQLPIQRADTLTADSSTLAVAAGTRLVAVDLASKRRIMDLDVTRLGAGELWVRPATVAYELAPSVAPGGGVAVLDRATGSEIWRATSTGDPLWSADGHLISSTANDEPLPAPRFLLTARDAMNGQELWRIPSTAQAFDSVVGTADSRLVTIEPHPAIAGVQRVQLLDSATGEIVWGAVSMTNFDSAVVTSETNVTLFGSSSSLSGNRGSLATTTGAGNTWLAEFADGIAQPPVSTPHGLMVVSGERTPTCISRSVGEPDQPESAVLGATIER